jgi:hypothetical protein
MGQTRARSAAPGVTVDTGALIALDRGDRRMIALLAQAVRDGVSFRVPAGVVGQAWRDGRRQATLARFLRAPEVQIVPLDGDLARASGELCGHTGTADVIDASVVLVARGHGDVILTGDADDLGRLAPGAPLVRV